MKNTLYCPLYSGKWSVCQVDGEKLKKAWDNDLGGVYAMSDGKGFYGPLISGDRIYTSEEGARAYISGDLIAANEYLWNHA